MCTLIKCETEGRTDGRKLHEFRDFVDLELTNMEEGDDNEEATLNIKVDFEDEELNNDAAATRFYGVQFVVMSAMAMRKLLILVYKTFKGDAARI